MGGIEEGLLGGGCLLLGVGYGMMCVQSDFLAWSCQTWLFLHVGLILRFFEFSSLLSQPSTNFMVVRQMQVHVGGPHQYMVCCSEILMDGELE